MRRRSSPLAWLAGVALVLGVIAVVAGGIGAFGTSVEVTQDVAPVQLPSDGSGGPFVMAKHDAPAGFTLFGIEFGDHTYEARIGFVPPDGCTVVEGQPFHARGACAGLPVEGEASGSGMLISGEVFAIVRVAISAECFAALEPGEGWPAAHNGCPG